MQTALAAGKMIELMLVIIQILLLLDYERPDYGVKT